MNNPSIRGSGSYFDARTGRNERGWAPDWGSRFGAIAGEGFQNAAEMIGFGDYAVKNNSLAPLVMGNGPPSIVNFGRGESTVIRHREYVGDLVTGSGEPSTEYTTTSFNLNPGNSSLFPWLARDRKSVV